MSTVIAYVRVSTDDQTTENQKQAIEGRYKVSKWFREEGISGAIPAAQRPALAQLLAYVREGDTVVVTAIDRLGRNTIDVLTTVETLKAKGVALVSMREGFDLSTPAGRLMLTMLAAVAELERENIKTRQMAGIERARAEGKRLGREKKSTMPQWLTGGTSTVPTSKLLPCTLEYLLHLSNAPATPQKQ